jgi:hypothetical protein
MRKGGKGKENIPLFWLTFFCKEILRSISGGSLRRPSLVEIIFPGGVSKSHQTLKTFKRKIFTCNFVLIKNKSLPFHLIIVSFLRLLSEYLPRINDILHCHQNWVLLNCHIMI